MQFQFIRNREPRHAAVLPACPHCLFSECAPYAAAAASIPSHLVADNGGEYLGVEFFAGTPAQFDRPCLAHCKPLYDIDYSPLLAAGTPFAIMEGGRCVGKGRVEMVVWGTA